MKKKQVEISVGKEIIRGTLVADGRKRNVPAVLLVHGWRGSEVSYLPFAEKFAQEGAVCLTINLRGHGLSDGRENGMRDTYTAADHLKDVLAAYDFLVSQKRVSPRLIGAIGASYGAYLLAIASAKRKFSWLAFRAPALYPDEGFRRSTAKGIAAGLADFRQRTLGFKENRALRCLHRFRGDMLVVSGELDVDVPQKTIDNIIRAAEKAPLRYRLLKGADHRLSTEEARDEFNDILTRWVRLALKKP